MRFVSVPLPLLFLVFSLSPLSAAYIAEYGFHLAPCAWCLYQRVPYALIVVLSLSAVALPRCKRMLVWGILFLFLVELALAVTHVGIEQHWWTFESGCLSAVMENSVEAELARLKATPVVPCDKPAFFFLGLSMAAWNVFYSLGVLLLGIFIQRKQVVAV